MIMKDGYSSGSTSFSECHSEDVTCSVSRAESQSVGGPQRQHVPGIKPCDLHEIALYLCGARTKREAERGSFFPVGERIGGKKEKMEYILSPKKGGGGEEHGGVTYH